MPRLWTPTDSDSQSMLMRWVEARLPGIKFNRDQAMPVAVMQGGDIAAVVVYHERRGDSIEMSNAADTPRWATKGVIAELLAYPFEVFDCQRITAIVHSNNVRARKFDEGIGFQYEGCMRCAFKDGDAIVMGITKRWWQASKWARIYRARRATQRAA